MRKAKIEERETNAIERHKHKERKKNINRSVG